MRPQAQATEPGLRALSAQPLEPELEPPGIVLLYSVSMALICAVLSSRQSRIWGGIHIGPDDFEGRRIGALVGAKALERAASYFTGTSHP
jgi:hypothetical protein